MKANHSLVDIKQAGGAIAHVLLLALSFCLLTAPAVADILWVGENGYWSNPEAWQSGYVPTGVESEGSPYVNDASTVSITNGDSVLTYAFNVRNGGVVRMTGGTWVNYHDGNGFFISSAGGKTGTLNLYDGSLYCFGNIMLGRYGTGFLRQYGGSISVQSWLTTAEKDPVADGRAYLLGGTFEQREAGDSGGINVGLRGSGTVLVGGTADVVVNGGHGLLYSYAPSAADVAENPTNTIVLARGGKLAAKRISTGTRGERRFVLDGGTLRVTNAQATSDPAVALTNLVHRFSFNGDANDSVGTAVATLYGSASLATAAGQVTLPGGPRGTAWVNLGANLLPRNDVGFTIEIWGSVANMDGTWLRCFDIGAESDYTANLHGSWVKNSKLPALYYGATGSVGTKANVEGRAYHVAVVATPNGDGSWLLTQYNQDAETCEMVDSFTLTPPAGWSPATQLADVFMLGHSSGNNADVACSYDEIRVWDRPLSARQVAVNAMVGPDAVIVGEPLVTGLDRSMASALSAFDVTERGGSIDTDGHDIAILQPVTASTSVMNSNLVHRFSFNGDANDSVGTAVATLNGSASLETAAGKVTLPGGVKGTAWVNLGANLLPRNDVGFTIEIWGSVARMDRIWQRCFDIGAELDYTANIHCSWVKSDGLPALYYGGTGSVGKIPNEEGRAYHLAVVAAPNGDGTWSLTQYDQGADDYEMVESFRLALPNDWSPATQLADVFMLGHSSGNDYDSPCAYDEVRIWDRPLTEQEILMNNVAGPDVVRGSFVKTGEGTLTLTGTNTFAAPVRVEKGTLALAANATLSETSDVTIATNAVLSLASNAYPQGTIYFEGDVGGNIGCISASEKLDLSKLKIALSDPTKMDAKRRYTIAVAPAGFEGRFASVDLPSNWRLSVGDNSIALSPCGLVVIFK